MSELNETTNLTNDAEPILPVEPEAAVVLDDMHQAIESAATDVKAAGDELVAAAEQMDALTAVPAAPVSSTPPEAAPSAGAVFTLPTLEEPVRPQAAAVNPMRTPSYDVNADDKLMSALAWAGMVLLQIPLVSMVLLLAEGNKDRPFQRHHAIQSIGFFAAAIVYEILATILFVVGTAVTLGCGALFLWVLFFVPHILAIYYAWQAYQGREVSIPVVTQIMRQQGWLK